MLKVYIVMQGEERPGEANCWCTPESLHSIWTTREAAAAVAINIWLGRVVEEELRT
jgi:hypothetical protein